MFILDAGLVFAQAASSWGERFCSYWGVGEGGGYEESYAPDAAESTDEEEIVFPGCEGPFDVPDSIAKEVAETDAKAVGCVLYSDSDGLLAKSVPGREG